MDDKEMGKFLWWYGTEAHLYAFKVVFTYA